MKLKKQGISLKIWNYNNYALIFLELTEVPFNVNMIRMASLLASSLLNSVLGQGGRHNTSQF